MFFCQISQILILCLDQWWIFLVVNLVICCRLMVVSVIACSQQVMGMGIAIWSLHSRSIKAVMLMLLSSHLLCTLPLFFSLFVFCILAILAWTVSIMKSCMNCTYFYFSWEPRGKREDCLFVPFCFCFFFFFTLSTCFSSSCFSKLSLQKQREKRLHVFLLS